MNRAVVDAHQHFWDRSRKEFDYSWQETPEMSAICRDRMPEDLRPLLTVAGVDQTILVQTQHNLDENRWALKLADQHDFIAGVVGWVDLQSDDCCRQLEEFRDHSRFVGIRHITQDEPNDGFIVSEPVAAGLAVLQQQSMPFDLLLYDRHLRHVPALARRFPDLPLVIDHLSKPPIRRGTLDPWRSEIRAAAGFPNVWCKLSGLVTEADRDRWSIEQIRQYADVVLECFGPGRLMFGSDWPVCELAAGYQQVYDLAKQLISQLGDSEQTRIMGGTAIEFYGLER